MKQTRRLVFGNIVRESAFELLAQQLGWSRLGTKPKSSLSLESVWQSEDLGPIITYVDDYLMQLQYLVVEGTPEEILAVACHVDPYLPFYTHDSIAAMMSLESSQYDPILAIYIAALIASADPDPEILSWFKVAMSSDDPSVRSAAYFATTYPGWREFKPMLTRASREDSNHDAREMAAKALSSLTSNVWTEYQGTGEITE